MKKLLLLGVLCGLLMLSPSVLAGVGPPETTDRTKVYDKLIERGAGLVKIGKYLKALDLYDRAIALEPDNSQGHRHKGLVLMGVWKFPEAKECLLRSLELDPDNLRAMVWVGRCEIYEMEYVRCFNCLKKVLERSPDHADGLAVMTLLLIHLDDIDRAEEVVEKALLEDPDHVFARVCRGHIKLLRKREEDAAKDFAGCLKRNRWSAASYVGLGQALSSMNRPAEALKVLNEGIRRNRFIPSLYTMRGFVRYKMKRVPEAVRDYRIALGIDMDYAGGHGVYSFYPGSPKEIAWPPREAKRLLKEALRAMNEGDSKRALERATEAGREAPKNLLVNLVRGAAAYAQGDWATTLECGRAAMALDSKAPLAHVMFLSGRSLKQEIKKLELSKEDFYRRFQDLPTPRVEGIERVFTNFQSLSPDEKKVVLRAVAPMKRYLPALVKEGAFHYILPLYMHLTDVEAMKPWKGVKTFDGRYYDAVRGAAGKTAVTGVETLWPTTRMGMNTLAHEFAHQVHHYGLRGDRKSEITRLYRKAKKEGCCVDFYAAENEQEYFAQGYEAFVSPFKRPTSSETAKNTRDDLRKKDPDFYRFLLEITGEEDAPPGEKK